MAGDEDKPLDDSKSYMGIPEAQFVVSFELWNRNVMIWMESIEKGVLGSVILKLDVVAVSVMSHAACMFFSF